MRKAVLVAPLQPSNMQWRKLRVRVGGGELMVVLSVRYLRCLLAAGGVTLAQRVKP